MDRKFAWIKRTLCAGIVISLLAAFGKLIEPYLGLIFIVSIAVGTVIVLVALCALMSKS